MSFLQTNRLLLEEITFEDAPFVIELLNNPTWLQYIGDRNVHTIPEAHSYIQRSYIHAYKKYGFGMYKMVLKDTQLPIGMCGLVKRNYLKHHDIGFALLPTYQRKGYTYEAASAVMNYANQTLQIHSIYAFTSRDNIASQNLLKKLGLQFEKYIKIPNDEEILMLFSN